MAENQPEGAENANEVVSKEIIDSFNDILQNILKAWDSVPLQDMEKIGKLHDDVVRKCDDIKKNYDKDDVFDLLQYVARIPYHVARGLHYNLVSKLRSSFDNYKEANHFCNHTSKGFEKIRNTMHKEFHSIFPILECCRSITSILEKDSSNILEYKENQVKEFRELAGWFRKTHSAIVRIDNNNSKKFEKELDKIYTLDKRIIDMYRGYAQEIEVNDEQIIFAKPISNKVFIVHGHNTKILEELKDFLDRYGIKPVILSDEPDKGKMVMEKFEYHAGYSGFTFVIMTKDDIVTVMENAKTYKQGRPNVFFELGWFCGRFGRRDRIRILKEKGAKIHSDLRGILTLNFCESLKEGKIFEKIKGDLEHSGIIEQTANHSSGKESFYER